MSANVTFSRRGPGLRHLGGAALLGALLLRAAVAPGHAAAQIVDSDGDGIQDASEIALGLEIFNPDTDFDGLTDGQELYTYGTHPNNADTDGDGPNDGREVNLYHTNPLLADTDGDGLGDGRELTDGTDPLVPNAAPAPPAEPAPAPADPGQVDPGQADQGERADSDGDGLYDDDETDVYGTDPFVADSDGDGADDGQEVYDGTDPLTPDSGDGQSDGGEAQPDGGCSGLYCLPPASSAASS